MVVTISPTWDLLTLVFLGLTITYSFIIGRANTVKFTVGIYISLLTADAIGNILQQYIFGLHPFHPLLIQYGIGGTDNGYHIIAKIIAFAIFMILLMLKGNFVADVAYRSSSIISGFVTLLMGSFSAMLLAAGVLLYVSGGSFLLGEPYLTTTLAESIYAHSFMAKLLIDYISVWFLLPSLAFVIGSLSSE